MNNLHLCPCLGYETFCELRRSVGWDLRPEPQGRAALAATARAVTAWQDDTPVGRARLVGDGIYWLLVDVAVRPSFQNRGIGRLLVEDLLQWAQNRLQPGEKVTVHLVSARGREPFYRGLGFASVPDVGCGAGMRRTLLGPDR